MKLTPEEAAELAVALGWHSIISGPTWATGFPPASEPHHEDDRDEIPLDLRELVVRTREAYQARLHTLEVRYDEQRRMSESFLKSSGQAAMERDQLAEVLLQVKKISQRPAHLVPHDLHKFLMEKLG